MSRLTALAELIRIATRVGELGSARTADVLLMCGDDDRGFIFRGRRYAQFADSLNELLMEGGLSTVTVGAPGSTVVGKSAFGDVFKVNGLLARGLIARRVSRVFRRRPDIANDSVVRAWRKVLQRVAAKAVIGIQPPPELCVASQLLGIWVADLQHGVLSDEGYYGNAFRERFGERGWPNAVLCWDQASADWGAARFPKSVELKVVGNPWLLRFVAPAHDDALVASASNALPLRAERPNILVSLQWGLDRIGAHNSLGIHNALFNLICDEDAHYNWLVRIHPMMINGKNREKVVREFRNAFDGRSNVVWEASTEAPLPLVLSHCDCHITSHSAVVIEAAQLGVPSAILDERRQLMGEWFGVQLTSGFAELVDPEETAIRQWIQKSIVRYPRNRRRTRLDDPSSLRRFVADLCARMLDGDEGVTRPHDGSESR